jgi:RimJ/RimL family protein N-acetyltransferase
LKRVRTGPDVPAIPDLPQPLGDEHVMLRFAAERDIPEILIAYQDDPQLHMQLGEERPPSGAELGRRAELAAAEQAAGTGVSLTILHDGSDVCRGQVNVHRIDWDNARAELGIWVAPQLRGNGLGRRALELATGWLLTDCGFERVQVLTEPGNAAMIHVAQAAGFLHEGVLRAYLRERGERVDAVVLSLLRSDLER